jgi:hypothetical protein
MGPSYCYPQRGSLRTRMTWHLESQSRVRSTTHRRAGYFYSSMASSFSSRSLALKCRSLDSMEDKLSQQAYLGIYWT